MGEPARYLQGHTTSRRESPQAAAATMQIRQPHVRGAWPTCSSPTVHLSAAVAELVEERFEGGGRPLLRSLHGVHQKRSDGREEGFEEEEERWFDWVVLLYG